MSKKHIAFIPGEYHFSHHKLSAQIGLKYIMALEQAGAHVSIVFSGTMSREWYLENCDGFVFGGGNDITPELYQCPLCYEGAEIYPEIDHWIYEFMGDAINTRKPILGICRGMQMINVRHGGTLIQDLEHREFHADPARRDTHVDRVSYEIGSFLHEVFASDERILPINSIHHQAVHALGDRLRIVARSHYDDVVEAIEHIEDPIYGVQWHPESLTDHMPLFDWFVRRC